MTTSVFGANPLCARRGADQTRVMHLSRPFRAATSLAVVALLLSACSASDQKAGATPSAEPTTLTLAVYDGDPQIQLLDSLRTSGPASLSVDVKAAWRLGEPTFEVDTVKDVAAGKVDLALVPAYAFASVGVTAFDGLLAPLGIGTYASEQSVLQSPEAMDALGRTGSSGVVAVGYVPGDFRRPVGMDHPLLTAADFDGARIATRPGVVTESAFRQLGATIVHQKPCYLVGTSGGDLGTVSTQNCGQVPPGGAVTANLALWPRVQVLIANPAALGRLDADQQSRLRAAVVAAIPTRIAVLRAAELAAARELCSSGIPVMNATAADVAALHAALAPVRTRVAGEPDAAPLLAAVTRIAGESPQPDDVPTCPDARPHVAQGLTAAPSALEGRYTFRLVESELVSSMSLSDAASNAGVMTYTLKDGAFLSHVDADHPDAAANCGECAIDIRGTYAIAPTGCLQLTATSPFQANFGCFRFSLFRDRLQLVGPLADAGLSAYDLKAQAALFSAKPWRRVSG